MLDTAASALLASLVRLSPAGVAQFGALTRAIAAKDAKAIRKIKRKWAGKGHASFDGALISPLARAAANEYPVVADFAEMTRFRLAVNPAKEAYSGAYITTEQIRSLAYEFLERRAAGCGVLDGIAPGSKLVAADYVVHPEDAHKLMPEESVEELSVPSIKHVRVSVLFQRVPGEANAFYLWCNAYNDANPFPLYNVFPDKEHDGIECNRIEEPTK